MLAWVSPTTFRGVALRLGQEQAGQPYLKSKVLK